MAGKKQKKRDPKGAHTFGITSGGVYPHDSAKQRKELVRADITGAVRVTSGFRDTKHIAGFGFKEAPAGDGIVSKKKKNFGVRRKRGGQ